jgi:hypothetical protein
MYPEDTYLMQPGRAVYANNYLEWLIIEVIQLLDATATMADLAAMAGGQIVKSLDSAIAGRKNLDANLIARLADLRGGIRGA